VEEDNDLGLALHVGHVEGVDVLPEVEVLRVIQHRHQHRHPGPKEKAPPRSGQEDRQQPVRHVISYVRGTPAISETPTGGGGVGAPCGCLEDVLKPDWVRAMEGKVCSHRGSQ